MLPHQDKCLKGLRRYHEQIYPKLRRRRARLAGLLAYFKDDLVLTLTELRSRHQMHLPSLKTLRAELRSLGVEPEAHDPELYSKAAVLRASLVFQLPKGRQPLRRVCRKNGPYRQQAVLIELLLTVNPPATDRVTLPDLCRGLPRLTPVVLGAELRRMRVAPGPDGAYHLNDLTAARARWIHSAGGRDLTADCAQLFQRLR